MSKRCYFLAVLFGIFAIAFSMRPAPKGINHDEAWVEAAVPLQIGSFRSVPGADGSAQSYRMDDETYKILQPFGIVTRYYENGQTRFDVAVIASNTRNSFHDPQHCFPGQDWPIVRERYVSLQTRSCGSVPLTVVTLEHNGVHHLATFCFQGPRGFVSSQGDLYLQWSWTNFFTGEPQEGSSYRVIGIGPDTTEDQLLAFTRVLIDSSAVTLRT